MKKAKSKLSNLVARGLIVSILIFCLTITSLSIMNLDNSKLIYGLIGLSFFGLIIFLLLKRLRNEPTFLSVNENHLTLKSFPFLFSRKYVSSQIIGFTSSTITYPYVNIKYDLLILYLKNGRKLRIIQFNFEKFWEAKKLIKSLIIKDLGIEKESYRFIFLRNYKIKTNANKVYN